MSRIKHFIDKQAKWLLFNQRQAALWAMAFAILPYFTWLSVTIVALFTLRKNKVDGLVMMLPVMLVHFGVTQASMSLFTAMVNTCLVYVPCYLCACILNFTISWRAVALGFFLQVVIMVGVIHWLISDFVMAHYLYIRAIATEVQQNGVLASWLMDVNANQNVLANYVLGIQFISIAIATLVPLMIARSVQSRLFYPEGFKQEILTFRLQKEELIVLGLVALLSMRHYLIAIDILPLAVLYFLFSGLSLFACFLSRKQCRGVAAFLILPLIFLPMILVPIYFFVGVLDSLFNLRQYFFGQSSEKGE